MNKIFNTPKINVYGGCGMLNKYVYMKREDKENKMYFIYQIASIIKDTFPITYNCNKLFVLIVPKNKSKQITVIDNLNKVELTNNDILYDISVNEYLAMFKTFVMCQGTKMIVTDDIFEK